MVVNRALGLATVFAALLTKPLVEYAYSGRDSQRGHHPLRQVGLPFRQEFQSRCRRQIPAKTKRIALLIAGDAFPRYTNQPACSRESLETQKQTSKSHVDVLIKSMETVGYTVRAFGTTYPCSANADMVDSLAAQYGERLERLRVIPVPEQLNGHEVFAISHSMADALASIRIPADEFDYYVVIRWDVKVSDAPPSFWGCAFDGKPFLRSWGHLNGLTWRSVSGNLDPRWMTIVPGELADCFASTIGKHPERCCDFKSRRTSCALCADGINAVLHREKIAGCMGNDAMRCPAVMDCKRNGVSPPSLIKTFGIGVVPFDAVSPLEGFIENITGGQPVPRPRGEPQAPPVQPAVRTPVRPVTRSPTLRPTPPPPKPPGQPVPGPSGEPQAPPVQPVAHTPSRSETRRRRSVRSSPTPRPTPPPPRPPPPSPPPPKPPPPRPPPSSLRLPPTRPRSYKNDELVPPGCRREQPSTKRVAMIIIGDSYRNGNQQLLKESCSLDSEAPQRVDSQSHMTLTASLESLGYTVRVFGTTYPCSNGRNLSAVQLPSYYGTHLAKLSLITRPTQIYGGQVYAFANATAEAVASIRKPEDEFEYYFVTRWDLKVVSIDASFWPCIFDGKPLMRHWGHMLGWTTSGSWGKCNMDWVFAIPGSIARCFVNFITLAPTQCCTAACMGASCVPCTDRINDLLDPAAFKDCKTKSSVGCPTVTASCGQKRLQLTKYVTGTPWRVPLTCVGYGTANWTGLDWSRAPAKRR